MEENQHKKSKKVIAAVVVVLLAVLGIAGYFLYYKKTPAYSLQLIRTAVKEHDWENFNAHVDLDSVYSSAFDAFVDAGMETDKDMDESVKNMAKGFIQMVKPALVSAMKDGTKRYVETGSFDNGQQNKDDKKQQANVDGIKDRANIEKSSFKGVAYTKKDDNGIATVGLTISDKDLGKDFTLDIKMRQLKDDTWQVIEISNLKEYLKAVEQAQKEKLAELNKPLQEQIDQVIQTQPGTASVTAKDRWGFSKVLRADIPLQVNSDKEIAAVKGNILVQISEEKNFKIPFNIKHKQGTEMHKIWAAKELNQFIKGEAAILKAGKQSYPASCQIDSIIFSDGEKLELYTKLP